MTQKKTRVLLLGWDAADWKIISRLIDNGDMPALQSLIENGVTGNISTLEPAYSPMLWTTIATGKYADKHGILGFSEPTPDHSAIRPVSNSSRKVKALWNILMQNGYKTHVINWWPSHPAEPVNGIYISNMYPKVNSMQYKNWAIPDDTVHPADLQHLFAHFRVHPLELSYQHLNPFIPTFDFSKSKPDRKIGIIAKLIAEASSVQAAATLALEQEEWDLAAIYWDTIDHFCHAFMNYSPPQMKGVNDEEYELFQHVIEGAYRLMDMMLGRLLTIVGDECNVILTSDHGFKSAELRQRHTPHEPAGPAYHHRNVGIFCAKGPGIRKDEIVYGASLLDITPTILSLFDLPIGEDMDGKPLIEIFTNPHEIKTTPSWEDIPGNCGMLPDDKRDLNPEHSAEAIKQLIALGYIEDPGKDITVAVEKTIDELDYNLAQVYYGTQRYQQAIPLLEKLFEKYPFRGRYLFKLVDSLIETGDIEKAEKSIEVFKSSAAKKILSSQQIEILKKRKVPEILTAKEKEQWINENQYNPVRESRQAANDLLHLKIVEGDLLLKKGYPRKALRKYQEIDRKKVKSKGYYVQMGKAYIKTGQWRDAEKMYSELLKIDPDHFNAHLGLGISCFNQKRYEDALEHLLDSVSLNFYNYIAHFNIGRTLMQLNDIDNGISALETSLRINPNFGLARNTLIDVYEKELNQPEKARLLKEKINVAIPIESEMSRNEGLIIKPIAKAFDSEPIIVVSGLPRSGTSMMMQMLEAGGIPVYSDEKRKPDENNPRGYFEHDKVKQLIRNNNWMNETVGKAVKIVVPLLYKIPPAFNYKVIFMARDMNEIIESQHRMLVANGKMKPDQFPMDIEVTYQKYLNNLQNWTERNKNVDVLIINYSETINSPLKTAGKISAFLNRNLDFNRMAESIDPELYRSKKT